MATSQQTPVSPPSEGPSVCFAETLFEAIHTLEEHRQAGLLRKETGDWLEQFQARVQQLVLGHSVAPPPYSDPRNGVEVCSTDGGDWYDFVLQDLLKANPSLQVGDVVYRGEKLLADPADFLPGSGEILETMGEQARCSAAGEWAANYPAISNQARTELDLLLTPLAGWARRHCQPSFYLVKNSHAHVLTEADFAGFS